MRMLVTLVAPDSACQCSYLFFRWYRCGPFFAAGKMIQMSILVSLCYNLYIFRGIGAYSGGNCCGVATALTGFAVAFLLKGGSSAAVVL